MGGSEWENDEIPQSLNISMSVSSNGYSVGNLATMTISGTLPYKYGTYQRNTPIELYRKRINSEYQEISRSLMYRWFLKDCKITEGSSISFSGVDAMAYTSNNYAINSGDTVGTQFATAQSTISALSGADIRIDTPGHSQSSIVYDKQSSWSIRSLMEASAKIDCANYYAECHPAYVALKKTYGNQVQIMDSSTYEPLSIGVSQTAISMVRVYQADMELPTPNTGEGETLADYGIYEVPIGSDPVTAASTMKIVTPFVNASTDLTVYSQAFGSKAFGTQFSCNKLKMPTLLNGYFFIPLTQIIFGTDYSRQFYICSASYSLTTEGVLANISGTTKSVSDYEYIGETEKSLRQKIEAEHNYQGTYFSFTDGLTFQGESTGVVNSG